MSTDYDDHREQDFDVQNCDGQKNSLRPQGAVSLNETRQPGIEMLSHWDSLHEPLFAVMTQGGLFFSVRPRLTGSCDCGLCSQPR